MKSKVSRKVAGFCAILMLLGVMSSCNRGVGCPTAFKAVSDVITVIK